MRAARVESFPVAKDRQIVIRLDSDLAARIDAYADRLRREHDLEIAHAEAVRKLLKRALDAVEKEAAPPPPLAVVPPAPRRKR